MFPNPHDALPLPPRPHLEHYKKRAKDLVKACHSSDPAAIRAWAAGWIDSLVRLADLDITPQLPVRIDHWTDQLETFARDKFSSACPLAAAQFIIARAVVPIFSDNCGRTRMIAGGRDIFLFLVRRRRAAIYR